jgi:polysaccharide export outer membrane protein
MSYNKNTIRIITLFLCLAGITSCHGSLTRIPQNYTHPQTHTDEIQIKVNILDEPELSQTYSIDDSGMILMPYIGKVQVNGKSVSAIEQDIRTRLQDGYILHPTVSVKKTNTNTFYIVGAVKNPGRYSIPDDAAVLVNAIAIAGGYAANADKKSVELVREKREQVQHYQNASVLSPLRAGDTIIVRGGGLW